MALIRSLLPVVLGLLVLAAAPARAGAGWTEDVSAALAQASKQKLPVLLEFTGSDWCPPCKAMAREVFDTPEFASFAEDKVVLVKLDFPRRTPQADDLKARNRELAEKHGIEGFPTMILLSHEGKELARHVGYMPGGPKAFSAWISKSVR